MAVVRLPSANPNASPPPRRYSDTGDVRIDLLFQSPETLLPSGGDDRVALGPASGRNAYGCAPVPESNAIAFSSSTASTISRRAYTHVLRAQERLIEAAAVHGLDRAFDDAMEGVRRTLHSYLALQTTGAEIVLTPSGTDAQLAALLLIRTAFNRAPTTCIVVGSDQTGSGTVYSAAGRHFGARTARGVAVHRGAAVRGPDLDLRTAFVPFGTGDGRMRTPAAMDEAVFAATKAEIAKGRCVILQTMAASKFGWTAPSDMCIGRIEATWPQAVRTIVDACQMRLSPERIRQHLRKQRTVLITGSKFYGGPAFSGAILLPRSGCATIQNQARLPVALHDYLNRADFPQSWARARADFSCEPNFGQWLRWLAALEEMRAYYLLAPSFRRQVVEGAGAAVAIALAGSCRLLPVVEYDGEADVEWDDEFARPTIFPFLLRDDRGFLQPHQVSEIHRALQRDISSEVEQPAHVPAATLCHIGQPVLIDGPDKRPTAALRLAIGARTMFEAWSPDPDAATRAIQTIACNIGIVIRKLELILDNPAIWTAAHEEPRVLHGR